jgi:hypothetical protein
METETEMEAAVETAEMVTTRMVENGENSKNNEGSGR